MPIKIGSTDINDIFIGANKVDNIFVGSNKVWSRPHLYSLTVGTRYVSIPGITITGKDAVVGSLSLLNLYQWWNSSITNLTFENFDGVSPDGVVLQLSNGGVLNNDASFTTMTLNGTVFNRTDADTYTNTGAGGYTRWRWNTNTNPFSSAGSVDRVRFERDV